MKFGSTVLLASIFSASAFQQASFQPRSQTALNVVTKEKAAALKEARTLAEENAIKINPDFDKLVKKTFPGAMANGVLESKVTKILEKKGYSAENTLLATSLCADELARRLEDDFVMIYGNNFNLGGLSGFPFAGNTGFGAMSAHIPDNGYCLIVFAPHVGITKDGQVGKVEREGIALVDNCCGSAIAASNYLAGITDGGAPVTMNLRKYTDFQQNAVQKLILPHGERLSHANDRMKELPYALYESQEMLMTEIIQKGSAGLKQGTAVLGGIQINTAPDTPDYFHPMKFEYLNENGEVVEDLLPALTGKGSKRQALKKFFGLS